jgi:hypothetical protein
MKTLYVIKLDGANFSDGQTRTLGFDDATQFDVECRHFILMNLEFTTETL